MENNFNDDIEEDFEDIEDVDDIEEKIIEIEEEAIQKRNDKLRDQPEKREKSAKEVKSLLEDIKDLRSKFEDLSHDYFIDSKGSLKDLGKGGRGRDVIEVERHLSRSVFFLDKLYLSLKNVDEYKDKFFD